MKKRNMTLFLLSMVVVAALFPQASHGARTETFHIGTYYYEGYTEPIDQVVPFDQLTHVCYAFAIPTSEGEIRALMYPEKLSEMVDRAHKEDVKVLIAVGGYSYQDIPLSYTFEKLASTEATREAFVSNLMHLVDTYHLDGVDLDWEYPRPHSKEDFEQLVCSLREKLNEKDKLLTLAIPGSSSANNGTEITESISKTVLDAVDWIHIMVYDMSGDGGHSPIWFANASLAYWGNNRGVPQEKLVLGVPFYARPSWKVYKDLVAENPANAFQSYVAHEDAAKISHYDSIGIIQEKTRISLESAGGIFSWEINMDTRDEYSLTQAITRAIAKYEELGGAAFKRSATIVFQNHEIICDADSGYPFIDENNRTLIPVRKISESIGLDVTYEPDAREAIVVGKSTVIKVPLQEKYIYVNGRKQEIDTNAVVVNNRVYIPMRVLFETFGHEVKWQSETRTALVE